MDSASNTHMAIEIIPPRGAVFRTLGDVEDLLKRFMNLHHPCWREKSVQVYRLTADPSTLVIRQRNGLLAHPLPATNWTQVQGNYFSQAAGPSGGDWSLWLAVGESIFKFLSYSSRTSYLGSEPSGELVEMQPDIGAKRT
jgi:hypothetical protein